LPWKSFEPDFEMIFTEPVAEALVERSKFEMPSWNSCYDLLRKVLHGCADHVIDH
jgi:hypothetical protein